MESSSNSQIKTLLAILKMAEHISGLHKTLGGCPIDHEWEQVRETILIHIGLSDYDYEGMIEHIQELGLGAQT